MPPLPVNPVVPTHPGTPVHSNPVVPVVHKDTPEEVEMKDILNKLGVILSEHNGLESSVPLNSEYWSLRARYRTLKNR